ncbi:hypothetical protein DL767_011385 [Monosporascus sp. MG133]|nr:hypothetical protein DL767_011385 [Monosporascus sp. MG133]
MLTFTISATTTIESAAATRTVTEFATAIETATSSSLTTVSSTSTLSSIASLTSSTTTSAVTAASSTLATTCQLGQTSPAPSAVLNPGFEADSDEHPWALTIRSVSSYTGSFVAATAAATAAGCRAVTLSTGHGGALWKLFSTPIVAFNKVTALELTYFLHAPIQGIYALLIDEFAHTSSSPPNACRISLSLKEAVNGTAQRTHVIRHPLVSGLVPGTGYKSVLVYNAQLMYQLPTGSTGFGQNGAAPGGRGCATLDAQQIPHGASLKGTVSILVDTLLPSAVTS